MSDARAARVLAGLDAEQSQAVLAPAGPVRILAGAGTGKTRTITHRVAYQVLTGQVDPRAVLAVTHSARAAGEMRDRIGHLGVPGVQTRTFHAAALRQLGFFWPATGLPGTGVTLVSSVRGGRYGMLRAALARTLGVRGADVESTDVLDLDGEVTWAKARLLTPMAYPAAAAAQQRTRTQTPATLGAAFAAYEQAKRDAALLDFDDLLEQCATLIEADPDVAARVRAQYRSFVVDEYQDTDPAQQRLLTAWLGERDMVTVVGDPQQAIYSFKGAEPSLLVDFTTRFPHAASVELVRNYRSTPQVVDYANTLMAGTATALTLVGQRPDGPVPVVRRYDCESAEEDALAARVAALIAAGSPAAQIAVLHRFNSQAVRLEAALRAAGVPVAVGEGEAFFDRPEIRRALADLESHAAADDSDGPAALRTVLAGHGFDPAEAAAGQGAARARWDAQVALLDLVDHLPDAVRTSASALAAELRRRAREEHAPVRAGAVTLCTIHKAKGLEWDVVLVPRLTEGSLPSVFAVSPEQVAEERRLLYVALTRARCVLELSCARERCDVGRHLEPSRFLSVLDPHQHVPSRARGRGRTSGAAPAPRPRPGRVFVPGQRVTHDQHGLGTVKAVDGRGVKVDFGTGLVTLPASDPKLDKL